MSAAVKTLEGLKRRLVVTIPVEEVDKAYQNRLQKIAQSAKIDGFRPGKVPVKLVEQRYGQGLRQEVAGELIQVSFEAAVKDHELKIAGMPNIAPNLLITKGQPFEYTVDFETYPSMTLADLSHETVEKYNVSIEDSDIDEMINKLRQQHAEWNEVDRPAELGDRVLIDFVGELDGKTLEQGTAKDVQLELGSKQMIPGFEEGLIGACANDQRTLDIKFPSNYHESQLSDKDVTFTVDVRQVLVAKEPELDEAFAEKLSIKGGLAGLRNSVRNNMNQEVTRLLKNRLKMEVLEKLFVNNKIDLPDALVDMEIKNLQESMLNQMRGQYQAKDLDKLDLPRDPYVKPARRRVALGLLLGEVIQHYKLTVNNDRVREHIEEMASTYQQPEQVINYIYGNQKQLEEVETLVLEEQAIDKLLENMQVSEQAISYQDAVNLPEPSIDDGDDDHEQVEAAEKKETRNTEIKTKDDHNE